MDLETNGSYLSLAYSNASVILPLGMFPRRLEYPVPHLPRWGENLKASGSVLTPLGPFRRRGPGPGYSIGFSPHRGAVLFGWLLLPLTVPFSQRCFGDVL